MQQWFMDYSRASHVADNNGQRAFALVNTATGQALANKNEKRADGCVQVSVVSWKIKVSLDVLRQQKFVHVHRQNCIAFLLID